MKHRPRNQGTLNRYLRRSGALAATLLALIGASAPVAATHLEITILAGIDTSTAVPVPHVMCHNETVGEFARAIRFSPPDYITWRCSDAGSVYASSLETEPVTDDIIVQKIRGKSDGTNPVVEIDVANYVDTLVSCRNATTGAEVDAEITNSTPSTEEWTCGTANNPWPLPSTADDLKVRIEGRYCEILPC